MNIRASRAEKAKRVIGLGVLCLGLVLFCPQAFAKILTVDGGSPKAADAADNAKYTPNLGFTQHAVSIPSPKFVTVNLWMTLWKNPSPDKEIAALEVRTTKEGIPGLITVSRGLKKKSKGPGAVRSMLCHNIKGETIVRKRILGRTGLEVSELSMGGLFVASFAADYETAAAAVHRALELGVNYIDTAPTYANSEEVLGKALKGVKTPYYISSKLGGRPQPFNPKDKDCLRRSVEESLRLLDRDSLDILMIHEPDRKDNYDWWDDWQTFHGPVREFLEELKAEKIIRFTGLGGTTAYDLAHIIDTGYYDVVLTAFNYNLLWQEAVWEIFPAAKKHNTGIIIGSPLHQGALAKRFDEEIKTWKCGVSLPRRKQMQELYRLLDETGMPLPELALRFVISNKEISTVLMGARSPKEVEQNAHAVEKGPLPDTIMKRLRQIAAMAPFRPYGEGMGLPLR